MVQVSTVRKLSILSRIVTDRLGRVRAVSAVANAARITGTHFARVLHILWLEVTGFIFFGIAAISGAAGFREYAKYQAGLIGPGKTVLAVVVTLMFAWFGVSSFWRVRKKGLPSRGPS